MAGATVKGQRAYIGQVYQKQKVLFLNLNHPVVQVVLVLCSKNRYLTYLKIYGVFKEQVHYDV